MAPCPGPGPGSLAWARAGFASRRGEWLRQHALWDLAELRKLKPEDEAELRKVEADIKTKSYDELCQVQADVAAKLARIQVDQMRAAYAAMIARARAINPILDEQWRRMEAEDAAAKLGQGQGWPPGAWGAPRGDPGQARARVPVSVGWSSPPTFL